jgi:predicted negative regulator of RcsB-dependent stress response
VIVRARLIALIVGGLLVLCPLAAQQDAAAERLLAEARRLDREGKVDDARTEYELLVQRFPGTNEAELAQLALAESYWNQGEAAKAETLIDGMTTGMPDSPNSAAAWVLRGRIQASRAANRQELSDARTPFRRVPVLFGSAEYPQLGARVEARVRSGELSLELGEPDRAALEFLEAIEDENRSPWLPRALYGLAKSLLEKNDLAAGADLLQRVLHDPATDDALRRDVTTDLAFLSRHWIRPSLDQPRWAAARAVSGIELRKPEKLAVAADGRVLIWDEGLAQVLILTADHQVESRSPQAQVRDVWFSPDGRAFAAVADAVIALADGSRQPLTAAGAALRDLGAGATGPLDERYVVDRDRKALYSFDRKGESKTLQPAASDVVDLAIGTHGELLVLDRKKNDVARIGGLAAENPKGFTGGWKRAHALAVDTAGSVYVLDSSENKIDIRDAAGGNAGSVGPVLPGGVELKSAEDIGVDGAGRLYVIDSRLAQLLVLE